MWTICIVGYIGWIIACLLVLSTPLGYWLGIVAEEPEQEREHERKESDV